MGEIGFYVKDLKTGNVSELKSVKELNPKIENPDTENYINTTNFSGTLEVSLELTQELEDFYKDFCNKLLNRDLQRLSRKRIKKLLMSVGIQRNDAEIMSWLVDRRRFVVMEVIKNANNN